MTNFWRSGTWPHLIIVVLFTISCFCPIRDYCDAHFTFHQFFALLSTFYLTCKLYFMSPTKPVYLCLLWPRQPYLFFKCKRCKWINYHMGVSLLYDMGSHFFLLPLKVRNGLKFNIFKTWPTKWLAIFLFVFWSLLNCSRTSLCTCFVFCCDSSEYFWFSFFYFSL